MNGSENVDAMISFNGASKTYPDGTVAVHPLDLQVRTGEVCVLVGASGCGKTTLLRNLNRMNDLIPGTKVTGTISYHGIDIYGKDVDPIEVRRRIGMVFQKPNPFPKSIYDNVAYGPRVTGMKVDSMDDLVEESLRCTYEQRAQQHQAALDLALEMERIGQQLRDRPESTSSSPSQR